LLAGQRVDRLPERSQVGVANCLVERAAGLRGSVGVVELEWLPSTLCRAGPTFASCDCRQPGGRVPGHGAVDEAGERGKECLLGGVLGVGGVSKEATVLETGGRRPRERPERLRRDSRGSKLVEHRLHGRIF
jgi:hypothetical protein